jgi:23S rRNA pseudouridine2605 synthase
MDNSIRIQKIIADAGYCSRRKAEEYIAAGLVKVNGRIARIGDKADPKRDLIVINGEKLTSDGEKVYLKLYKPRGYITSMADSHGGKLITDLLADIPQRVYPVGRLDKNSEGLILLTNDGAFANRMMHPSSHVEKLYRVTIPQRVTEEQIAYLSAGVTLENGEHTQPCKIEVAVESDERTVLLITLREGKNRQIRRMCETLNLPVSRLKRVRIGQVKLGMLKPGEYVELTPQELQSLGVRKGRNRR